MTARSRLLIAGAAAALLTLTLAGCTADAPDPKPSASATLEPGITDVEDAPGSGENLVGALADTSTSTCERQGDAWTVAGTVKNPTDTTVDYRIYVSLLNSANDTRALVQVDSTGVEPAKSKEWSVEIPVAEDELNCVLRVERYEA